MSRKAKFDKEVKLKALMEYINGVGSLEQISQKYGCSRSILIGWVEKYRVFGDSVFNETHKNRSYSSEFKQMIINEYLKGGISYVQLTRKYDITSQSQAKSWVKMYNNHKELKSYKKDSVN